MIRTAIKILIGLIGLILIVGLAVSAYRHGSWVGALKALVALAVTYQLIALVGRKESSLSGAGSPRGLTPRQTLIGVAVGLGIPFALLVVYWWFRPAQ
ncbi:hypothetical protein [Roseateles microcysteis]|uniref:hypothetical protein n=1 Tax=Roseateles microcysteis TaxID=3119057 RepID=UPI002FE5E000